MPEIEQLSVNNLILKNKPKNTWLIHFLIMFV